MIYIDLYYKKIITVELIYKLNLFIYLYIYIFVFFQVIDFLKFNMYIFSRFFRNIRLNFLFFKLFVSRNLRRYLNNRKHLVFLNSFFIKNSGIFFFINIEFLFFEVFRNFFKYNLAFFFKRMVKSNLLVFFWNDIYSNLIDLNDMILYRDSFFFKYELPHVIYYIYLYFYNINLSLLFYSFLGYKFFFKKRYFRFKFFSKIL